MIPGGWVVDSRSKHKSTAHSSTWHALIATDAVRISHNIAAILIRVEEVVGFVFEYGQRR